MNQATSSNTAGFERHPTGGFIHFPPKSNSCSQSHMTIYGSALLSLCLLTGLTLGRLIGAALGVEADVGGVVVSKRIRLSLP